MVETIGCMTKQDSQFVNKPAPAIPKGFFEGVSQPGITLEKKAIWKWVIMYVSRFYRILVIPIHAGLWCPVQTLLHHALCFQWDLSSILVSDKTLSDWSVLVGHIPDFVHYHQLTSHCCSWSQNLSNCAFTYVHGMQCMKIYAPLLTYWSS